VLTVRDDADRAAAILPFAVRRQHGLTFLSLAGLYQPVRSFPCVPETATRAAAALADALLRGGHPWAVVRFCPVDEATVERAALLAAMRPAGAHALVTPLGRTIVNTLLPSLEDYRATSLGKRCDYYERRWMKEQPGRIEFYDSPTGERLQQMFRHLDTVEQNSWLRNAGGDLRFSTGLDRDFWLDVSAGALAKQQQLQVWIAYHERDPVAFRFTLSCGSTSYLLANQYDEQVARYSLGWVLYMHQLKQAFQRGTRTIDLAPNDLHYKGRLGGKEADMRLEVLAFPDTAGGKLLGAGLRTARKLKTLLKR